MEEKMTSVSMCRTTTGMGNIIGNLTLIVREFIKGIFPKNFFHDEWIDTEMVQNEQDKTELTKKKKPCLVIRPKVSIDDDSLFGKLPDWINTNYFIFRNLKDNYCPVFMDEENQIYMYCSGERVKVTFDIEIILDSKLQQINTAFFLKGSALHKSYFYIENRRLESEIPKYYMKQIANMVNKDLKIPEEREEFNRYINKHSQNFVEEKVKLASGNYGHFYLFKSNILSLFPNNPDIDDGESQGMTYNNFKISDSLETEFWCPLNFFLEVGRKFDIIPPKDYNFIEDDSYGVNLHYTLNFPLPDKYGDMDYHSKLMIITDDDTEKDTVNISDLFTLEEKKVIQFATEHKILMSDIFHVDLYLNNLKVDDNNVLVDWDTFILTNLHPKINDCYTIVLYKNKERYNRTMRVISHIEGSTYN